MGGLDAASVEALGDAIWGVTTDTSLGVEIYRQSFFRLETAGGFPTQSGYDQMARDILTKLTREFPLQPCDARNDKPGSGCPRNPQAVRHAPAVSFPGTALTTVRIEPMRAGQDSSSEFMLPEYR